MLSSDIDLVILDFDGVLTDNRVYVMEDGREAVACHRGDGWGISILGQAGIEVMILSTESNPVVSARATKLGIECLQNCNDKASATSGIIKRKKVDPSRVMYVGNDTNDAEAMALVGHPAAPADAHPSILKIAKIVTQAGGGYGVVRELADLLVPQRET
jgi:YrbI family 3-deoxy-D-manno-octulosonate 8-phosphate phosphatase